MLNETRTPEQRARKRATEYVGLLWHIVVFVVVNIFLWTLDIVTGGGIQWAFWATIPWGVGLLLHAVAYNVEDRGLTDRKYEQFLEEEQLRTRESKDLTKV